MLRDNLDDVDFEFIHTLVKDDQMVDQVVVVVRTYDADGQPGMKVWVASDGAIDQLVGLMEMAKLQITVDYGQMQKWLDEATD